MAQRWMADEIALLGTMTDAAVAARTGHTEISSRDKRWQLGIAAWQPHAYQWAAHEVRLLGKLSDAAVAQRLGIARRTVLIERQRRGIGPANPRNRPKHLGPPSGIIS